jgi:DNA polymerase
MEPSLVKKIIRQKLETERAFGIFELPLTPSLKKEGESMSAPSLYFKEGAGGVQKAEALRALFEKYKNCQLCSLSQTRTHLVFGAGNPDAKLMFVGEAPGADEDEQGLPFVGRAGQLLTKIIEAMKLKREDVYIANCLKCRPPNNRPPLPTEIVTCNPILACQIEIIAPKIICTLGKFASQTVLRTEEPISRLRGKFFERNGIKILPTYHPAYLLRNPADKKIVWEDMQKIMKEL